MQNNKINNFMSNWIIYNKKADFKKIGEDWNISPLVSRIMCNRGVTEYDDIKKLLSSDLSDLNDESLLPNIDKATDIIIEYIKNKKKIRIVGDYDIDGVCATFILYDALSKLGADISYYIPHRVRDGYGMNKTIVDEAIKDKVDLILTCDNGISAGPEITYAKNNNVMCIVTDHHEVGEIPTDALAIVDPKLPESTYPYKDICGGVVAWKVIKYLYKKLKKDLPLDEYLEFASISTVGDIMPLLNENHIIAKLGLKKIPNTKNKGLYRLLEVSNLINKELTAYHLGFIIGPLINAAGRLDDATLALNLFISNDDKTINEIADKLKNLNDERKKLTDDGEKRAEKEVEDKYKNDKVLVIYIENMNESVSGIVAGRIKEKYNKPTIIMTDSTGSDVAKASARSIDAYDMFSSLSFHKDLFIKFGGHKGAAGFSMYKKDIDLLRKSLNEEATLTDDDFVRKTYIDAEVNIGFINEKIIYDIERLEPYGQKLERPAFACKNVRAQVKNVYGDKQNVIKMKFLKDDINVNGVFFYDYPLYKKEIGDDSTINIIYYPKVNSWHGVDSVELNILDFKPFL